MKRNTDFMIRPGLALVIVTVLAAVSAVRAQDGVSPSKQDPKPPQSETQKAADKTTGPAKPAFTITVKTQPILNISLKADKVKLSEIGQALSKKLKIPVFVGEGIGKELVSTEYSELTFEPAMQLLAPAVYIDYEIRTGSGAPPRPLGVFFYAADQPEPSPTALVTGSSQSLLIEGNTEDGVEETEEESKKEEEEPLKVTYANGLMSVKAKKQPLALVLLKIGEELGIPVDIQSDATEIVDIEINKMQIEDIVRRLSPNIQMFLRADLTHAERRALRIVLPQTPKAAEPGF